MLPFAVQCGWVLILFGAVSVETWDLGYDVKGNGSVVVYMIMGLL